VKVSAYRKKRGAAMRIVVTGGTGVIGRPLVKSLADDGHEVIVLSRSPDRRRSETPAAVRLDHWDGQTVGAWASHVDGAGAVINFAGEGIAGDKFLPSRWTADKKRRIRESRVSAGSVIVEAIRQASVKPGVLLQSSAVGYYGPRGDEIVTEGAAAGDGFLAEVCVDWEEETADVEALGVRRVIARTGIVLTEKGGPLQRLKLPYKLFGGVYFGNGRQWWPWIHIDDEIKSVKFLLENEAASGPFNLTAPNPVTNRDFGKALGRAMRRPSYMPVPGFALRLLIGEVATVIMDGQRAVPEKLQSLGYTFDFPEVGPALMDIVNR
jgi:uncharacterized protein (TIGR01777 family)